MKANVQVLQVDNNGSQWWNHSIKISARYDATALECWVVWLLIYRRPPCHKQNVYQRQYLRANKDICSLPTLHLHFFASLVLLYAPLVFCFALWKILWEGLGPSIQKQQLAVSNSRSTYFIYLCDHTPNTLPRLRIQKALRTLGDFLGSVVILQGTRSETLHTLPEWCQDLTP